MNFGDKLTNPERKRQPFVKNQSPPKTDTVDRNRHTWHTGVYPPRPPESDNDMAEGKLKVYSEVLKQIKPFKATTIVQTTGLSRQLAYKHLTRLVEGGYLEKDGTFYCLVARGELMDLLMSITEAKGPQLLQTQTGYVGNIEKINKFIQYVVLWRSAKICGYQNVQKSFSDKITETIKELEGLRRYVNSKQLDAKKSAIEVDFDFDNIWKIIGQYVLEVGFTKQQAYDQIQEAIKDS